MRVEWDAADVRCGRIVGKPSCTERWMIGYVVSEGNNRLCLVSLADGMVIEHGAKEVIALALNTSALLPAELLERAK
jgi:hypothetical protein